MRYNVNEDVVLLYQMHQDGRNRHICAPELEGKLVDVIKHPSKYPEVMKVFRGIKHLVMHFRWAPRSAPHNIKALFLARFISLESFGLLYHPFISEKYVSR